MGGILGWSVKRGFHDGTAPAPSLGGLAAPAAAILFDAGQPHGHESVAPGLHRGAVHAELLGDLPVLASGRRQKHDLGSHHQPRRRGIDQVNKSATQQRKKTTAAKLAGRRVRVTSAFTSTYDQKRRWTAALDSDGREVATTLRNTADAFCFVLLAPNSAPVSFAGVEKNGGRPHVDRSEG